MGARRYAAIGIAWLALAASAAATADDDPHAHHREMMDKPPPTTGASVVVTLFDVELVNQDDQAVMFVSDVIGDRIVVMDFIYTTCTTVCPVLTAVLVKLQEQLGERLGSEVNMVSVSVDPTTDTPARLRAFAAKHQVRPGWTWLTGHKRAVEKVLTGLGAYTPDYTQHPAMVLVGDGRTGEWRRFYGFPNPDHVMREVEGFIAKRRHAAAAGSQQVIFKRAVQ